MTPPRPRHRAPKAPPVWIMGGGELCELCEHPYPAEMEHRCAECDRALCALCAQRVHGSHEKYCSRCHAEAAKS